MAFFSHAIQVRENIRYGADRYRYRDPGNNPVLVLHTVEGSVSFRVAAGHRNPPHLWYSPARRELFQTMDLSGPAQALVTGSGFETNHRGPCFQVEIEGFARGVRSWPETYYRNLAQDVIAPLEALSRDIYGVGFLAGATTGQLRWADELDGIFLATTRSPLRLTATQWRNAHGLIGHQHVPGNSHWDPGFLDVARLIRLVNLEALTPRELHLNSGSDFAMRGTDVAAWQQILINAGYDLSPWGADGRFGAATDVATRSFQSAKGLEPDGIVGPEELAAAEGASASTDLRPPETSPTANTTQPGPTPASATAPTTTPAPSRPITPWPQREDWHLTPEPMPLQQRAGVPLTPVAPVSAAPLPSEGIALNTDIIDLTTSPTVVPAPTVVPVPTSLPAQPNPTAIPNAPALAPPPAPPTPTATALPPPPATPTTNTAPAPPVKDRPLPDPPEPRRSILTRLWQWLLRIFN